MGLIRKNLICVDADTGEVQDSFPVNFPYTEKLKDPFSMLTSQGLMKLATDSDLKVEDWRVLMIYLSSIEFENVIRISQRDVAEILGICKQNVSRATKKLVSKNILLEESKAGKTKIYRLNTVYGWKGKIGKDYRDYFEQDSKLAA